MPSQRADQENRRRKGARNNTLLVCISLSLSLILAELLLRLTGHPPFEVKTLNVSVAPEGIFYEVDRILGYRHVPGQFRITHPTEYTWTTTHGPDGLRITEPWRPDSLGDSRPEIWIFGCSYTHGWSLDDAQTYPWLLQQLHPQLKIVNFGVGGYGTVNSLLQFKQALRSRKRKPVVVIVAYAEFHDQRNTSLRKRYKGVVPWSRRLGARWRPHAWLDGDGKLRLDISEVEYREFPFMRYSALVHTAEKAYNRMEVFFSNHREVSQVLLENFSALATDNDIESVVAGIEQKASGMLQYLAGHGIQTVDISVDLKNSANRNVPHDNHPSSTANQAYATKLSRLLVAMNLAAKAK